LEINEFVDKYITGKSTLGVQIRLTDMASNHNVKKFDAYVDKVNKILKSNKKINQIFLATDDETIIQEFQQKVSVPVIFLPDIYRATKDKPDLNPYDRYEYIRPNHRYLLGKEVILDVFILASCDYILKADISSVSQLAVIFSKSIKKTYFMKDFPEVIYKKIRHNKIVNWFLSRSIIRKTVNALSSQVYTQLYRYKIEKRKKQLHKDILNYYNSNLSLRTEYGSELDYISKKNKLEVFPYKFIEKYNYKNVLVELDKSNNMFYVMHNGKKLYYPRNLNSRQVAESYSALSLEQDSDSPHHYFSENFKVNQGEIFVDVGCSEGMIALDVIEKAKKIYLFECESRWIEAINETFKPWKEKIVIINKLATNENSVNSITLDSLLENHEEPIYMKLDVEGYERLVLSGASKIFSKNKLKLSVCTYHKHDDAEYFDAFFKKHGFEVEFSKGFMLFFWDPYFRVPYFRKALIRAKNYIS